MNDRNSDGERPPLAASVGPCRADRGRTHVRRLDRPAPIRFEFVAVGDVVWLPQSSGLAQCARRRPVGIPRRVLLLAVAWLVPSRRAPEAPAAVPEADTGKTVVAPPSPPNNAATPQPARHIDAELKNAILLHVPKSRQVKLVVLSGDAEANQFAWEIDAFLKSEGYQVISPHLFFMMTAGGKTPSGTTIYPDESDPNVLVIRIGLNDRDPLAAKQ
jgi:hypothetical protein